jgi:glutamyl-tRNA reductase
VIIALSAGRDSPPELRARLAYDEEQQRKILNSPRPGVGEVAILVTCHRTEVYATADGTESDAVHTLAGLLPGGLLPTDHQDLRFMDGSEAVEHLFRVACGLDSLVIGENQVLGQIRRAYTLAEEEGAAGPVLSNLFGRAIRLGRRARSETALGRLGMSVGTITADHLSSRLNGLQGRVGAVVGAGEAAADAARALSHAGATLSVMSRKLESAKALAGDIGGEFLSLDDLERAFDKSDFAVVAVSGKFVVGSDRFPTRTPEDPFLVIDLSVPPSVERNGRTDVELRSLEELPGPRGREVTEAVIDGEALVKKEIAELERWADTRESGPVIRDLRRRTEAMVREEVGKALAATQLSPEEAEKVAALAMRIANKILHGPSVALREGDKQTRELIRRIFGIE